MKMEVLINREKIWKRRLLGNLFVLFIFGGLMFGLSLLKHMLESLDYYTLLVFLLLWFIIVLVNLWLDKLYTNSLTYIVRGDKLMKSWETIVKRKDSARLQVINSVDITQSLIDRLFNMFNFKICYGMGGGHYFDFPYLSEKEANKLMNNIKTTGKKVIIK